MAGGPGPAISPFFPMSATESASQTYTCGHCDGEHPPSETVEGSFCSWACYYRHRGESVLSQLESDAHYCNSCFGRVRDIDPVPAIKKEGKAYKLDGFQYRTPLSTIGVDDFSDNPYQRVEGTRWSCGCGAVDPSEYHDVIVEIDMASALANLYLALVDAYNRGAIPFFPNKTRYFDAFRDPWRGAEYAIGVSVYG